MGGRARARGVWGVGCRWTPPSVYQGLYNPLNRLVEDELIPTLRANGCGFVACVASRVAARPRLRVCVSRVCVSK